MADIAFGVLPGLKQLVKALVTPPITSKHTILGSKHTQSPHNLIVFKGRQDTNEMTDDVLVIIRHDLDKPIQKLVICVDGDMIHFKGIVKVRLFSKHQYGPILQGEEKEAVFIMTYNEYASTVKHSALRLHIFDSTYQALAFYNSLELGPAFGNVRLNATLDDLKNMIQHLQSQKTPSPKSRSFKKTMVAPAAGGRNM